MLFSFKMSVGRRKKAQRGKSGKEKYVVFQTRSKMVEEEVTS